jgi:hypothetical protein
LAVNAVIRQSLCVAQPLDAGDARWRRRPTGADPRRPLASRLLPEPTAPDDPVAGLVNALVEVRAASRAASYPLAVPSAGPARESVATLLGQVDDYLIPRLMRLDGPVLAVVGGSTGAGKSTLVNSLVRAPVSPAGVLRPTTRAPLLVGHPTDTAWFGERSLPATLTERAHATLLPGLTRSSVPGDAILQLVNAPHLTPGLALIDAPDIDSVVASNRMRAAELLAAGDLWLFLTTAARYADAVPWRVLRDARDRGATVAVVLDRVPAHARDEVSIHFARMLGSQGLGDTGLFIVAESTLDEHGLLPEDEIAPIKRWLDAVARSSAHRTQVMRRTVLGAVSAAGPRLERLAEAADHQVYVASALAEAVHAAYGAALDEVHTCVELGAMLRGEVYVRWRELVASGELRRAVRARTGRRRTEARPAAGRPLPGKRLLAAIGHALADLIAEAGAAAAQQCQHRWRGDPAGRVLLAADPALGRGWPGFAEAAEELVGDWQAWLRTVVRQGAPRLRTPARSYTSGATLLLATVATVAPAPGDVDAAGAGPALLRTILADDGLRGLGAHARAELLARVRDLLGVEVARHLAPITAAGVDGELSARLRAAAGRLYAARTDLVSRLDDAA